MTRDEVLAKIERAADEGWRELNLSGVGLKKLPPEIASLQNLQSLYLENNQISEISEALTSLQNLQFLYLRNNQINKIPESLPSLKSLKFIYLANNQIRKISEALASLQSLKSINLENNRITEIPEVLISLENLQFINLSNNQISEIPEVLTSLQSLRFINLSNNQIREIPEALASLQFLQSINLSNNQIREIPEVLASLQSLQHLDLYNNQISEIPESLETLFSNLEKLDLRENLLSISPEILEDYNNPAHILNYLRQLHSNQTKPLNEAKLLLVGQGSVGKTSLVKQLIDQKFDPNEPQTDGLSVRQWPIEVNSKTVRLNVWDFGGQEIYHATHQFFLTKRSLYLLVCNCRTSEEENRIEYWLKLIQTFGGGSPVLIVGNKKDEQPLDINRRALREKYPNIVTIIETSCQTSDGIDDLRHAITTQIEELREVHNLLPLTWFDVKEQLEQMPKDFISYNEYIGICYEHQIPEEHNQEHLIDLLHDLGLVLNFREDQHPTILQNTNVLNPNWVTAGIYAILSDEILKLQAKGMLNLADLSCILDSERYPAERHHYLTELMKEFQLCFELPDCPDAQRFLIPGLLPKDEPEQARLAGDTLDFQYHYLVLPGSIISRFIVLSHEQIHKQIWWRSGVMLVYYESEEIHNIARVRADPEDKKIFISISGRETTRREFLALIRNTFNTIHRSFADLDVTEWVPVPEHPKHPPLKYKELLGLEQMGVTEYPIGTLGITINPRELLEGYEPLEMRRQFTQDIQIINQIYTNKSPEKNQQYSGEEVKSSEAKTDFFSCLKRTSTTVWAAVIAFLGLVMAIGGFAGGLNDLNDFWDREVEPRLPEQTER
ncbi:MAG: COR domain-containing protein [Cyanobacteria bacterium P01_G01_bin.54]